VPKTHTLGFFLYSMDTKYLPVVKVLSTIIVLVTGLLIFPQHALAAIAESSATIAEHTTPLPTLSVPVVKQDNRVVILHKFLASYNSPLTPYAQTFVTEADKNNIDWKLLPAIAGVESYFGMYIPPYSYNGWGFGVYGTNTRRFASWNDAIATITKSLREDYMDKWHANDVYAIGRIYAADPLWADKVSHFMDQINLLSTSDTQQNQTLPISL